MTFYLSAIILGLGFSLLALGIFLSLRVFNFPDITTDGSFTLGGAVTAVMLVNGYNPFTTLITAMLFGAVAGMCTGIIHTKMKVKRIHFHFYVYRNHSHKNESESASCRHPHDDSVVLRQSCHY